ncbi:MAG: PQQ-binding-like beta-propeller repeat protein [Candidatus Hodarchaeota archaeon]
MWTYQTAGGVVSSPALGDLDGDGGLEIAVGSEDGWLYVINPPTTGQRIYW